MGPIDPWIRKARGLTQALILSGTINVGFLCTFIYFALKDNSSPIPLESESSPQRETPTLSQMIAKLSLLSFQDLLGCLENHKHIENGCTYRDIALSCLVQFHHFNIESALGGISPQKREFLYTPPGEEKSLSLTLFPGLEQEQFQAILSYAKKEKWPLTAQGLFLELKKEKPPYDPSLLESIYLTPEFHYIHLLFSKTGIPLKKESTATLLAQSDWNVLRETTDHLRFHPDFTLEDRRHFLIKLMEQNSRIAARILLESDTEYCQRHLDNPQVLFLCRLLGDKTPSSYLRSLLESPRSDEVWKLAAEILYDQAGEQCPENLDLEQARARFISLKAPSLTLAKTQPTPGETKEKTQKKMRIYTVRTGDNLWKIAKEHRTSIQKLQEVNQLDSDRLKIGQTLLLP